MKEEKEVREKQLEQVVGGESGGAIYNDGEAGAFGLDHATNPISGAGPKGRVIYNNGATDGAFGLGKAGALAPNEVPNGGTDHAGIGGGCKK